jgi:acyl-CoA thioesterase FadM
MSDDEYWMPLRNISPDCFACGPHNHEGLHMTFATNGERIRGHVTIPEHVRGWSHLSHGGVTTTILDEAMAWACIYFREQFPLTREIKVRFSKPVFIGDQLTVYSWVGEEKGKRQLMLHAEIRNLDGELMATAEGDFAPFTPEQFAKMELVPLPDLHALEAMFQSVQPYQRP